MPISDEFEHWHYFADLRILVENIQDLKRELEGFAESWMEDSIDSDLRQDMFKLIMAINRIQLPDYIVKAIERKN